ncbi:MAG: phosphotransferase [Drouetiella hepatica Uher 2000/2452]|jgi:thiamine kinase-like enzyme|uniref:Phosphotransferase n=1 Tax=Drouetiella hepatica Uher 2000/2452 TaxID=904376 RepID=A0A951ULY7_9CYAN|nr:phosphotransferase [Drouetiella hepatica Uher 2000/2452]
MVFLLSSQNVFQYLIEKKIISAAQNSGQIESKTCKNFNLLIHFPSQASEQPSILIKQEPHDEEGDTNGDFLHEWQVYELVRHDSEFSQIKSLLPEAIRFDQKHSIVAFNYLKNYCDLDDFYTQNRRFSSPIATALGAALAEVHRISCDRQDYKEFLAAKDTVEDKDDEATEKVPDLMHELENLTPESFGAISADGLKFYELYQRYDSLGQAIRQLNAVYEPICLIHNDLKLSNILLHHEWESLLLQGDRAFPPSALTGSEAAIRLIDWEKWLWGDPASDLGTLVANYLKIWLKSLVVRAGIDLNLALRLASVPLEVIQPSMVALVRSYLAHFPEILERFPDFVERVMQFTGMALIESIQTKLHYQEPFGNIEICMLQVAKTLLCSPLQAIETVFGLTVSDLLDSQVQLPLKAQRRQSGASVEKGKTSTEVTQPGTCDRPLSGEQDILNRDALNRDAFHQQTPLQDLVNHIQIKAHCCIHHPRYSPSQPPEAIASRLPMLPADLQRGYLKAQLQNYLYDIYFSGEICLGDETGFSGTQEFAQTLQAEGYRPPSLENNRVHGLDVRFYEQLRRSNWGEGYFDPEWQVVRRESDGTFAVQKEELTLHIDPLRHLPAETRSPSIGDIVAIRLPKNRIETGFYVAVGNAGLVPDDSPAIELYFNVTPAGAIALMQNLTQRLNAIALPFVFKVLSDPVAYGRYDAGILQVERSRSEQLWPVLQQVYAAIAPEQVHATTPLFTKTLAPGLGLAEEPEENTAEDFGTKCCKLVAEGLLSVWQTKSDSPQARMSAIRQQLMEQGLNWQKPYLNPHSEDIYPPLGFTID